MLLYLERVSGEQSPFSIGCSIDMGRGNGLYFLDSVTSVQHIYQAVDELLGSVEANANGGLNRILPAGHPFMPWYISGISSLRGTGGVFSQQSDIFIPFTPQIRNWCLYNKYEIQVEFGPRSYPVLNDFLIGNGTASSWYPETGGGQVLQNYTYFREWERFTDIEITPSNDTVAIQMGQMAFNTFGMPLDARPFLAMPKKFMNNEMLKLTWYQVPMTYYTSTNSYLRRFRGRVNQNTWTTAGFGTYQPGELLYLGCSIKRYTPPLANNVYIFPNANLQDFKKYCNIEMLFSYTNRPYNDEPAFNPQNHNVVVGGHNLQPYFGSANDQFSNTWQFANTVPSSADNAQALWPSGPIPEMLFTNPDANDAI